MDAELPITPYAGSSGWSGSSTSERRAAEEDASGVTAARQRAVLIHVSDCGEEGATWHEVADALGLHHGQVTSALSNLHRSGHLIRTSRVRGRSKVYMSASYGEVYANEAQGRKRSACPHCGA